MEQDFLPISREDLLQRGWYYYDFLLITGDAYVDHPLLRHRHHQPGAGGRGLPGGHPPPAGLAGPCGLHRPGPAPVRGLRQRGQHRLYGGPLHRRQKRRHDDAYPPGNRAGLRPDRATIVYANRVREAFGDIPSSSAGWRPVCAALPTMTIGRTRCAAPSS